MVIGVGGAIGVVALLAVLSRFQPAWFPPNDYAEAFPDQLSRLNYPLNYPNGVAALMAMGAPLLAVLGVSARSPAGRVLATAALPLLGLAAFLTFSRSGLLFLVIGIVASSFPSWGWAHSGRRCSCSRSSCETTSRTAWRPSSRARRGTR